MKADYVHNNTLTIIDYINLQKENKLIVSYNQQLLKENEELKKQLEEQDYTVIPNCDIKPLIDKYKTQQQEFIEYMEKCIKELEKESLNKLQNVLNLGISNIVKEILQKYKEIIGDKINDKK